jgi:hypothetical protein
MVMPARGVHDDDAFFRGGDLVDVVGPAPGAPDALAPGGMLEGRRGGLRRSPDHHAVVVADDRPQLLWGHLPLDVDLDPFLKEYVDAHLLQVVQRQDFHARHLL